MKRNHVSAGPTCAPRRLFTLLALLGATALAPATFADVLQVPQDFASIQGAVDAASPGDIVLIAPAGGGGDVDVQQGITLVTLGGTVGVGELTVHDVPAGQTFVARGLSAMATYLHDNAGSLTFETCSFQGQPGFPGALQPLSEGYDGGAGLRIQACSSVALLRCSSKGGDGADLDDDDSQINATAGGPGVHVRTSLVVANACTFLGGKGGTCHDGGGSGREGGSAIENRSTVLADGCTLTGGNGGHGDCDIADCGYGGFGGDVISQGFLGGAVVTIKASLCDPGKGGLSGNGTPAPGGQPVSGGTAVFFTARYRPFWSDSPVVEGMSFKLHADLKVGDTALILASLIPAHVAHDQFQGVQLIGLPSIASVALTGSGLPFTVPVVAPQLPSGVEGVDVHLQAAVFDRDGNTLIGPASIVTVIDSNL